MGIEEGPCHGGYEFGGALLGMVLLLLDLIRGEIVWMVVNDFGLLDIFVSKVSMLVSMAMAVAIRVVTIAKIIAKIIIIVPDGRLVSILLLVLQIFIQIQLPLRLPTPHQHILCRGLTPVIMMQQIHQFARRPLSVLQLCLRQHPPLVPEILLPSDGQTRNEVRGRRCFNETKRPVRDQAASHQQRSRASGLGQLREGRGADGQVRAKAAAKASAAIRRDGGADAAVGVFIAVGRKEGIQAFSFFFGWWWFWSGFVAARGIVSVGFGGHFHLSPASHGRRQR
mmetsp:Transcript_425/g.1035  ORF Transcript_425/g.1035 Transcript_425/m.1035 type:complete len:282 (-) Transcript_425:190-1035(-)